MTESPIMEVIRAEIGRKLAVEPAFLAITPRPPLEYQSNRLYDVCAGDRHLIAKEYLRPGEINIAPLREYEALRMLSPLDVAPQPVFFDPSAGPVIVYEYMEGQMWDRQPVTAEDLSQLMDAWLKVNTLPADWLARGSERPLPEVELEFRHQLETYLEWTAGEFQPGVRAAEMCLDVLESRHGILQGLAGHTPLLCFCRSDPRFANVIRRPNGQLGLVDWEDSGLRDPAREVADLLTHPNQEDLLPGYTWQAFVQPYLEVRSRMDGEVASRARLYLAIFPLFWLNIIIRRGMRLASDGQLANWKVNGLPGNERLRRYLARALSWPEMDYRRTLEDLRAVEFFPVRAMERNG